MVHRVPALQLQSPQLQGLQQPQRPQQEQQLKQGQQPAQGQRLPQRDQQPQQNQQKPQQQPPQLPQQQPQQRQQLQQDQQPQATSLTHRAEYMRFLRGCANKKKFPIELAERFNVKQERPKLFTDWLAAGEDFGKVLIQHKKRISQLKTVTQKYGYRTKAQLL